jgi:hypothetical protein
VQGCKEEEEGEGEEEEYSLAITTYSRIHD